MEGLIIVYMIIVSFIIMSNLWGEEEKREVKKKKRRKRKDRGRRIMKVKNYKHYRGRAGGV